MKHLDWTVFVSQTGSEVLGLCHQLGVVPKLLITNNPKKLREDVMFFLKDNGCKLKVIPFKPLLDHYLQEDILSSKIITLHGYLRILPSEFIESYRPRAIYNGHPGLITEYPELKGKDPQIRAFEGKYHLIGSVIHEVTAGVDEGEVVHAKSAQNVATTLDGTYELLKYLSLRSWYEFFREKLLVDQD